MGTVMNNASSNDPLSGDNESAHRRKPLFHFWRCFWLTFLFVSLAYAWYSFYAPANDIAWADNYAAARRQAGQSNKPMILSFTGTWCVPCRVMKRQVWADEQVKRLVNAKFVPVSIDVGDAENAEVMAAYKVEGAPVTIVCDPKGDVVDWRAGGISKPEFLELVGSSSN